MSKTGTGASCQIQFELSYNNASNWTTGAGTGVKLSPVLTTTDTYTTLSTATRSALGPCHEWSTTQLNSTPTSGCVLGRSRPVPAPATNAEVVRIDHVRVRVQFDYNGLETPRC